MDLDDLRAELDMLVEPEPATRTELAAVKQRVAHRRRVARARYTTAGVAAVALLAAIIATIGSHAHPVGVHVVGEPTTHATSASRAPTAPIVVSAATHGFGPVAVTVGPLVTVDHAWLQHTVTYHNSGRVPVYVDDDRTSVLLPQGQRLLLVADRGCGYTVSPTKAPTGSFCYLDYHPMTIPAHGSATSTVFLWRDLPGMPALRPGDYVFAENFRWRTDRQFARYGESAPGVHIARRVLTYRVQHAPDADGSAADSSDGPLRIPDGRVHHQLAPARLPCPRSVCDRQWADSWNAS